jgi:nitrogen fixation/metabolism regulation signal transduction histidine kinase
MVSEDRLNNLRQFSRLAAGAGAVFALIGVLLLYFYVWETFSTWSERLQWWAVISIVLAIIFVLGYVIAADMVRSMEREARRKLSEK